MFIVSEQNKIYKRKVLLIFGLTQLMQFPMPRKVFQVFHFETWKWKVVVRLQSGCVLQTPKFYDDNKNIHRCQEFFANVAWKTDFMGRNHAPIYSYYVFIHITPPVLTVYITFRLPKGRSFHTTKVVMHGAFGHSQLKKKKKLTLTLLKSTQHLLPNIHICQ